MRILMISGLYEPYFQGGAEVIALTLAKGLQRRGHAICVATTQGQPGQQSVTIDGIEIKRFGIKNSYWHYHYEKAGAFQRMRWHLRDIFNHRAAQDIAETVKDFAPDIAVCHNLAGFSISVWKELTDRGIPAVQVLHDYYTLCPRSALFRAGRNCLKRCVTCSLFRAGHATASKKLTGVIAVSQAVMDIHKRFAMFEQVPLQKVIYNAQSISVIPSPKQKRHGLVLGFIGRLSAEKGIALLLESFKRLAADNPDVELLVAGTGEPEYLKSLVDSAKGFKIKFLGKVNSEEFYHRIDVCIVPSIWQEPLGLVAIEALANGVPVIGSKLGGIPEIVKHRFNGLIFDPGQTDGLLTALDEIVQSDGLRTAFGEVAANSVRDFIDEDRMLNEHETLYFQAIELSKGLNN